MVHYEEIEVHNFNRELGIESPHGRQVHPQALNCVISRRPKYDIYTATLLAGVSLGFGPIQISNPGL